MSCLPLLSVPRASSRQRLGAVRTRLSARDWLSSSAAGPLLPWVVRDLDDVTSTRSGVNACLTGSHVPPVSARR